MNLGTAYFRLSLLYGLCHSQWSDLSFSNSETILYIDPETKEHMGISHAKLPGDCFLN